MSDGNDDQAFSFHQIVLNDEQLESARRTRRRARSSADSPPNPQAFSWEDAVDTGDYDPHHFFTGSTDDNGSISITVRVPSGVHQQVQQIIQQRRIANWATMQDVFRDAVIHRLHFAMHEYVTPPALARLLEVERTKARTEMARNLREAQSAAVEGVKEELAALTACGDLDGQRRFLDDNWRSYGAFSEPYRSQFRQVLEAYGPMPEWVQEYDERGDRRHYLDDPDLH